MELSAPGFIRWYLHKKKEFRIFSRKSPDSFLRKSTWTWNWRDREDWEFSFLFALEINPNFPSRLSWLSTGNSNMHRTRQIRQKWKLPARNKEKGRKNFKQTNGKKKTNKICRSLRNCFKRLNSSNKVFAASSFVRQISRVFAFFSGQVASEGNKSCTVFSVCPVFPCFQGALILIYRIRAIGKIGC